MHSKGVILVLQWHDDAFIRLMSFIIIMVVRTVMQMFTLSFSFLSTYEVLPKDMGYAGVV